MKGTRVLMTALAVASSNASPQSHHYDALYGAQPGAVFNAPIEHRHDPKISNAHAIFSYPGQKGYFSEIDAALGEKPLRIQVWQDRIIANGKSFRLSRAIAFPGEQATYIFPDTSEVFVAASAGSRAPLICVSGHGSASGEASSRYQQIFLVIDPLGSKPTVLQLPGLLSSCRAVVVTKDGKLAYPKNSYLYDDVNEARIGLLLSYYTFDGRRFAATGSALRLRFVEPENPFQFSPLTAIGEASDELSGAGVAPLESRTVRLWVSTGGVGASSFGTSLLADVFAPVAASRAPRRP
jgi:hypothetical protein